MRRTFLIAGLMGLVAGVAGHRLACPAGEWMGWQRRWKELRLARGLSATVEGIRSAGGDRCVTCHLGMIPGAAVGGERLFAPHPPLACSLDPGQAGCQPCHRGDGRRLTRRAAHGLTGPPGWRLLGPGEGQVGCASCHRRDGSALGYDDAVVPDVGAGLRVFLEQGCPACHRLRGVASAGEVGPPLAGPAFWREPAALRERLRRPQALAPGSPMPPLAVAPDEERRLLLFLRAQASASPPGPAAAPPRLADHFPPDYPAEASPAAGAIWARRLGCVGCHRLGEEGSGVPDLRQVGWYARGEELRTMLLQPGKRVPGSFMPPLAMPSSVLESLLAWLAQQRRPLPSEPATVARELCGRCHGKARDPKVATLARRPPVLEGSAGTLEKSRFLEAVKGGRTGTAMPPWGRVLSPAFIELLQLALQAGGR